MWSQMTTEVFLNCVDGTSKKKVTTEWHSIQKIQRFDDVNKKRMLQI